MNVNSKKSGKKSVAKMSDEEFDAILASSQQAAEMKREKNSNQALQRVITDEELCAIRAKQEQEILTVQRRTYENVSVSMSEEKKRWFQTPSGRYVRLEQFDGDRDKLKLLIDLFNVELTEPYVDFTYNHFIFTWPDLCLLVFTAPSGIEGEPSAEEVGEFAGGIVSNCTYHNGGDALRGYIAMLAIKPVYRKNHIAQILITETVELMRKKNCTTIVLETPVDNKASVGLYTGLGFAKTKFLHRYYIKGQHAWRLKLFLDDTPVDRSYESVAQAIKNEERTTKQVEAC